jgi:hypothetical protein
MRRSHQQLRTAAEQRSNDIIKNNRIYDVDVRFVFDG